MFVLIHFYPLIFTRMMLELGKEKPWPDALASLTGEHELSADALLEYFKPLQIWLDEHRSKNNYSLGWKTNDKMNDDPNDQMDDQMNNQTNVQANDQMNDQSNV